MARSRPAASISIPFPTSESETSHLSPNSEYPNDDKRVFQLSRTSPSPTRADSKALPYAESRNLHSSAKPLSVSLSVDSFPEENGITETSDEVGEEPKFVPRVVQPRARTQSSIQGGSNPAKYARTRKLSKSRSRTLSQPISSSHAPSHLSNKSYNGNNDLYANDNSTMNEHINHGLELRRQAQIAKRKKIIREFYETERAYVDGLDLIHDHFLAPLISALPQPQPTFTTLSPTPSLSIPFFSNLSTTSISSMSISSTPSSILSRSQIQTIFANFIDVWNFHRSFLDALTDFLTDYLELTRDRSNSAIPRNSDHYGDVTSSAPTLEPPALSTLLKAHFPYLALYTPFITSFPSSMAALTSLSMPSSVPFSSSNAGHRISLARSTSNLTSSSSTTSQNIPTFSYSPAFANWLKEREADEKCKRLKLRDWMLTIVQRCPRYLLLIKDLIACTGVKDIHPTQDTYLEEEAEIEEKDGLTDVHAMLERITSTLNTSLRTHNRALSLLAIQRQTPNLPPSLHLISPGRVLLKQGLFRITAGFDGQSGTRANIGRIREVLLFGDILVWLAIEGMNDVGNDDKNEARTAGNHSSNGKQKPGKKVHFLRRTSSSFGLFGFDVRENQRWWYVGHAMLVDVEVVVTSSSSAALSTNTARVKTLDIHSPEASFSLTSLSSPPSRPTSTSSISGSSSRPSSSLGVRSGDILYPPDELTEWADAIRNAKEALLQAYGRIRGDTTLTSSRAGIHLRKRLVAVPFSIDEAPAPPTPSIDEGIEDRDDGTIRSPFKRTINIARPDPKRNIVDHYVPPIWIADTDARASACMRCQRSFSWRRRRHHCRLCGSCVCNSCSERTFYTYDANATIKKNKNSSSSTPLRACNVCFDAVFSVLPSRPSSSVSSPANYDFLSEDPSLSVSAKVLSSNPPRRRSNVHFDNSLVLDESEAETGREGQVEPLASFPSLKMLARADTRPISIVTTSSGASGTSGLSNSGPRMSISTPADLMTLDFELYSGKKSEYDDEDYAYGEHATGSRRSGEYDEDDNEHGKRWKRAGVMRRKPSNHLSIPIEFQGSESDLGLSTSADTSYHPSASTSPQKGAQSFVLSRSLPASPRKSASASSPHKNRIQSRHPSASQEEHRYRCRKRYSLPILAIQQTSVTAGAIAHKDLRMTNDGVKAEKRFSLVLDTGTASVATSTHVQVQEMNSEQIHDHISNGRQRSLTDDIGISETTNGPEIKARDKLKHGIAAARLNNILKRS